MEKKTQLLLAVGLGLVALALNKWYLSSRIEDLTPKENVEIAQATTAIEPGVKLSPNMVKGVKVPKNFASANAIKMKDLPNFIEQEVEVSVGKGDYMMESFFSAEGRAFVGNKLADQVQSNQQRAVTIPVDELNSLARSIRNGDHIDILFSMNIPGVGDKATVMLLQDVPVIATGAFSGPATDGSASGQRRYGTLTLLLTTQDAMRLSYARQGGTITILLRGSKNGDPAEVQTIAGVKDILSEQQRQTVETAAKGAMGGGMTMEHSDQIRSQLKELLERQRSQAR